MKHSLHNALGYCSLDKVWKLTSTRATRMTTLSSKPLLNYLIKLMKTHKKCRCLTQCRLSDRRVSAKLTAKCSFEMLRGSSLFNISRVCLWNKELPSLGEGFGKSCSGLVEQKSNLSEDILSWHLKTSFNKTRIITLFCLHDAFGVSFLFLTYCNSKYLE